MDKLELANRYKAATEGVLGLVATINDDASAVVFKHPEFGTFLFVLDAEKDPEYLMLLFPSFMDASRVGGDRNFLVQLANDVNIGKKAVKVSVLNDEKSTMTASIECFVAGPDQPPSQEFLNTVVKRQFGALLTGVRAVLEGVSNRVA